MVRELVDRWGPRLEPLPWPERLELLADIHEQLFEDIGDLQRYAEISPQLVAGLIDRWGMPPVVCDEQAHIYANSAVDFHRAASGEWFHRSHDSDGSRGKTRRPALKTQESIDRRRAPRVVVDRPTTLVASGRPLGCRLVDVSTSGAGIEVAEPLSLGSRIEIDLPNDRKAAGKVVRAEPPSFGLVFATPIPSETVAALQ
ncbi:MAG: hypothetical protein GVY13_11675 [Alphaproteobacteria bacterium]|nr:hypothetical protein [Alphaproteobacteria bacterium]